MSEFVIRNCISWNHNEMRKASADALNGNIRVPPHAKKRVYVEGRAKFVPMTADEYRADRMKDVVRFKGNIALLERALA